MMATPAETKTTTNHVKIKHWVEERGGRPSIVTATKSDGSGLLRVDFGEQDEALEEIRWDDFFRIFDENDLAFLYQEQTSDGDESYFHKFISRSGQELDSDKDNMDDEDELESMDDTDE